MPADSETAFAKINLALHVRARRADGYHTIETIFAFADDGDRLSVEASDTLSLQITGPFAGDLGTGSDNLVLRAAEMMRQKFDVSQGAALTLDKRLPVASGIGGGSADAAAAARLLNRFWNIDASHAELAKLLAPLGADIPACVDSFVVEGHGTGTSLVEIDANGLSGLPLLLINPRKPVSTAEIFKRWDGIDLGPLGRGNALQIGCEGRNDLEPIAVELCPEIGDILDVLNEQQPKLARMSGSGASCFALFANEAERDAAATAVAAVNISWWTMTGALR